MVSNRMICEGFWAGAYYFSTHGCRFWLSLGAEVFEDDAPLAAATAAARALLLKKLAITDWQGRVSGI